MTNGSGTANDSKHDFMLYDKLLKHEAREALQNYPVNVSSATLVHFTYRYDYVECKEQVEEFVIDAVRKQCAGTWNEGHPVFNDEYTLPDNNLGYSGKLKSRRRVRQTLRLAQMLARVYSRPGRRAEAARRNDNGAESDEPRLPGEGHFERRRIGNSDSGA